MYFCTQIEKNTIMIRFTNLIFAVLFATAVAAQPQEQSQSDSNVSSLQQKAETELAAGHKVTARSYYVLAYEDYVKKGDMKSGVDCGIKATDLYYKNNEYQEAFELLRNVDQTIRSQKISEAAKSALHYQTSKERMDMYMKMRKGNSALDQLHIMEAHAKASNDEAVQNDLLYNKAIYYYTFGQNEKGNAVFKEMAGKLTRQKEYDKVEEVYKTLIANGRRSNSANMVAQSYGSYVAWKDSVYALKAADAQAVLKKQIADNEASIAEKDSTLTARMAIIVGLCILSGALAVALVACILVLMRFIFLSRRQKKTIKTISDNNAMKAQFISNISAQMAPALSKLDGSKPEVKAMEDFVAHIQTMSDLEGDSEKEIETEDIQIPSFCEGLMDQIRNKVKSGVTLNVNAPKMTASFNKEYLAHVLSHLLQNAAEYTPEGGTIWLEYKKRGAHSHQFLVSNTGANIPEEEREEVFKPFRTIQDLTKGDGLGLPICKQMAIMMKGNLDIDPQFTKGTRFVLDLHS